MSKIDWTEEARRFRDRLIRARHYIHNTNMGTRMSTSQQLTDEAAYYAERGDLDEARHRLRLRDHPKWQHPGECQSAYDAVMAEKRGVSQ